MNGKTFIRRVNWSFVILWLALAIAYAIVGLLVIHHKPFEGAGRRGNESQKARKHERTKFRHVKLREL